MPARPGRRRAAALVWCALWHLAWAQRRPTTTTSTTSSSSTSATSTSSTTQTTTSTTFTRTTSSTTTLTTTWLGPGTNPDFLRLGNGDCLAPASRPVMGISRRDMDHGSCRAFCRDGTCLGYSYAPCELLCTLYGPASLLLAGRPDEEAHGWGDLTGWGSISHSTGRCGSACFLRKNPCAPGTTRSAGAVVPYGALTWGVATTAICPAPYRGYLELGCGISGVEVLGGRCLRQCLGGSYYDRDFQIFYPPSWHGDATSTGCPRGAQGNITMRCYDGEAMYESGRCGYNCPPGSLRAGSGIVFYPAMPHQAEEPMPCPPGWVGSPRVRCDDSWVTLASGQCYQNCAEGTTTITIGLASGEVDYDAFNHSTSVHLPCPAESFSGEVSLHCRDGSVAINWTNSSCKRSCPPGNISSSYTPDDPVAARRNVSHGQMEDGTVEDYACQAGFYSYPPDLVYVLGEDDGFIYRQPISALAPDGGFPQNIYQDQELLSIAIADDIMYVVRAVDRLIYRQTVSQVRAQSLWDGPLDTFQALSITIAGQYVYGIGLDFRVYGTPLPSLGSDAWEKIAQEDINITCVALADGVIYAAAKEEKVVYYKAIAGPFSTWDGPITGQFNLQIISMTVAYNNLYAVAGKRLYMQSLSNMSTQSRWMGPVSNELNLRAATMVVVNKSTSNGTWNAGFNGTLIVQCTDGDLRLLQGQCRMHCLAGAIISNNVVISHPNMSHGSMIPLYCPWPTHTGLLKTYCEDGRVYFKGTCGLNCAAINYPSKGADVQIPVLNHTDAEVWTDIPCPLPFAGNISARCFFGVRRVTGECMRPCSSGTWMNVMQSASVAYPQLNHSQSYTGGCVQMWPLLRYSGNVTFTCSDSTLLISGGCYPDCTPGFMYDHDVKVNYGQIPSGYSTNAICEPSAFYGTVQIACSRGYPQVINGSCGIPCFRGLFKSAATRDYPVDVPDIPHLGSRWVTCPPQVSGTVLFQCRDKTLNVVAGSCGDRCLGGQRLDVYGASFISPLMNHMEVFQQNCTSPYFGKVVLTCTDGNLDVKSLCVQGCFAGNVTIIGGARIKYPDLVPGETLGLGCPDGFAGFVTLRCGDLVPSVESGACNKHCQPARFTGDGWNMVYPLIYHSDTLEMSCPDGWDGYLVLNCTAGVVTLQEGNCFQKCVNGRYMVRSGVYMRYPGLAHGEMTPSMECPDGYVGSVRLNCTNGVVNIGEGGCPANCQSGNEQGARYNSMLHLENSSLVCPVAGALRVQCVDGAVTVLSGKCFNPCAPGTLYDANGSPVVYRTIAHLGNVTGTCAGNATGYIQVNCSDTVAMLDPLPGQRCNRNCAPAALTTADGSIISSPGVDHGQRSPIDCPNGLTGVVTVYCSDGVLSIASGMCGPMNCAAGLVDVWQTAVPSPMINDGMESVRPSKCPKPYLGEAIFACHNGTAQVVNVSLRYPAVVGLLARDFNASNASAAYLMQHWEEYFGICGCCTPAEPPPGADPIPGVDQRVIIVWALSVAGAGVLLATGTGLWLLRPHGFFKRLKASRIHAAAMEEETSPSSAILAIPPSPQKAALLKLKGQDASHEGQALQVVGVVR